MSIALLISACDRTPGPNYLGDLVCSLYRSGCFDSPLLYGQTVHVIEGGSVNLTYLEDVYALLGHAHIPPWMLTTHRGARGQHANETFAQMVRVGARTGAEWVVTLEDDVVVARDFLTQVDTWMRAYATPDYPLFPLYCPYQDLVQVQTRGERTWKYPVTAFYGTQGLLWRAEALVSYAAWYQRVGEQPCYWDMLLKDWATATYSQQKHFLTPVPSLVQHVGAFSALGLHDRFHTAPVFVGEAQR